MVKYIIHAEKLWHKPTWDALVKLLEKKGRKCYVFLMPPQYHYQQSVLGFRGTKRGLDYILKKRYQILKRNQRKYGYGVGMHLHFALHPGELSEDERLAGVKYAYLWINNIFRQMVNEKLYEVTNISFGWFKYDDFIKEVCDRNELRIVNDEIGSITLHDYDLPLSFFKIIEKKLRTDIRLVRRFFRRFAKKLFFRGKRKWPKERR